MGLIFRTGIRAIGFSLIVLAAQMARAQVVDEFWQKKFEQSVGEAQALSESRAHEKEVAERVFHQQSGIISTAYHSGEMGAIAAIMVQYGVDADTAGMLFDGAMRYFEKEAVRQGLIAETADRNRLMVETGVTIAGLVGVLASGGSGALKFVEGTISAGAGAATAGSTTSGIMAFTFKTAGLVKEWDDYRRGRTPTEISEGTRMLYRFSNGFAAVASGLDATQMNTVAEAYVIGVSVGLNPEIVTAAGHARARIAPQENTQKVKQPVSDQFVPNAPRFDVTGTWFQVGGPCNGVTVKIVGQRNNKISSVISSGACQGFSQTWSSRAGSPRWDESGRLAYEFSYSGTHENWDPSGTNWIRFNSAGSATVSYLSTPGGYSGSFELSRSKPD